MNIIFFANGNFGVNALKGLDESEHNILALVTNTDKTKGRGLKKSKNNIYNEANCRKINIIQEDNIHKPSFIQKIKNLNADAFIVISYKIIPIEIFNIPKFSVLLF